MTIRFLASKNYDQRNSSCYYRYQYNFKNQYEPIASFRIRRIHRKILT